MLKKITWLACATLLCALLIALPAAQTALASSTDVAKIGDKTYATLAAAVDDVPQNTQTIITLLMDAAGDGIRVGERMINGKKVDWPMNITFDLAGHTYNIDGTTVGSQGTETNGFQLLKNSTVTFKTARSPAPRPRFSFKTIAISRWKMSCWTEAILTAPAPIP